MVLGNDEEDAMTSKQTMPMQALCATRKRVTS
jgi:hypothetical protein